MVKAVFQQSEHSHYADRPGEVYHFPRMYLGAVSRTVGDWVIFYEGRRGGGRGYYGVQKVERVVEDPSTHDHYFAIMDAASALDFPNLVSRTTPSGATFETGLAPRGGNNTLAVRQISDADFAAIVAEGLKDLPDADSLPRDPASVEGFADPRAPFISAVPDRGRTLQSRAIRDAAFARSVRRAYRGRCAMSGLELRNGGGRPEVEAAHIKSVAGGGPDVVANGLALSGTLHWMFDRGLVSVDDDYSILVARDTIAAEIETRLLTPDRRLILPVASGSRPHPAYLNWHRDNCFKG